MWLAFDKPNSLNAYYVFKKQTFLNSHVNNFFILTLSASSTNPSPHQCSWSGIKKSLLMPLTYISNLDDSFRLSYSMPILMRLRIFNLMCQTQDLHPIIHPISETDISILPIAQAKCLEVIPDSFLSTSYLLNGQIIVAPPSECSHNPTILHVHSYDPFPNNYISCLHLCNMQRPPDPLHQPSASAPQSFIYIAAVLVVLVKLSGYISFLFWTLYNGFPSQ